MSGKAMACTPCAAKSLTHACACSAGRVTTKQGRGAKASSPPSAGSAQSLGDGQAQALSLRQSLHLSTLVHTDQSAGLFGFSPGRIQAQFT